MGREESRFDENLQTVESKSLLGVLERDTKGKGINSSPNLGVS